MTKEELTQVLSEAGQVVDVYIPTDRVTGRPRGFAFVTMGSSDDARAAISALDGTALRGRNMKVSEAQERSGGN